MALCQTPAASPPAPSPSMEAKRTSLLPPSGDLVLRVHAPQAEAQTVRIRSPKCTIGSGAGCTLRLRSPGVGAIHGWILRGSAGTVYRRLEGPALVNGSAVNESALRPGDRLKVGPLELEVVECNEPATTREPYFQPLSEAVGEVAQLRVQLRALENKSAQLDSEARQGFESSIMAAERADQLRDGLAAAHEQLEETCRDLTAAQTTLQAQVDELENNQRQLNELHANQRGLAEQLDQAGHLIRTTGEERDAVATELQQVRAALAEFQAKSANDQSQLQEQRLQFDAERAAFESERTQLQRRLAQRDAELDALRSSAAAQTGAMTVAFTELSETQRSLTEELSERCASAEAQLAAAQAQFAEKHEQVEALQQAIAGHGELATRHTELERAYEQKCVECTELEQGFKSLQVNGAALGELEAREQALISRLTELADREAKFANEAQELVAAKQALAAERDELAPLRSSLEDERNELLLQQQELDEAREQLASREFMIAQHEERQEPSPTAQRAAELEAQQAAGRSELAPLLEECREQKAALAEREEKLNARYSALEARELQLLEQASALEARLQQITASPALVEQLGSASSGDQACVAYGSGGNSVCQPRSVEPPVNCTAAWPPSGFEGPGSASTLAEGSQQSEFAAAACIPDGTPAENISDSNNVEVVLSRLVRAGLWRTDGEPADTAPPAQAESAGELPLPSNADERSAVPPAPAVSNASPQPAQSGGNEEDEESIELYMERLMKRVQGDAAASDRDWKPPVVSPPPSDLDPDDPAPARVDHEPAHAASSAEYSPRRTAPELNQSLSAMRALANTAARSAIDRHVRQHTVRQAVGKLIGAFATLTASVVLGYWAHRVQSLPATTAAGIGGSVGVYWTWAAFRRLGVLRRLNQSQAKAAKAEPPVQAGKSPANANVPGQST